MSTPFNNNSSSLENENIIDFDNPTKKCKKKREFSELMKLLDSGDSLLVDTSKGRSTTSINSFSKENSNLILKPKNKKKRANIIESNYNSSISSYDNSLQLFSQPTNKQKSPIISFESSSKTLPHITIHAPVSTMPVDTSSISIFSLIIKNLEINPVSLTIFSNRIYGIAPYVNTISPTFINKSNCFFMDAGLSDGGVYTNSMNIDKKIYSKINSLKEKNIGIF